MNKNSMVFRSVVMVAAVLTLGACGDDDAAVDRGQTPDDDTTTSGAPEPSAESTTTDAPVEQTQVEVEAWANEVVTVYGGLSADQVDNAVRFVEIVMDDPDVDASLAEVDAYRFVTNANSEAVTTAVEQMPPAPDDPTLTVPYGALLDALRAEAEMSDALADELEADSEPLEQEVTELLEDQDYGGGPLGRFDEIRLAFSQLQDETTTACFALQAAMTERGLALLDCTGE